jgi:hypothetical protein
MSPELPSETYPQFDVRNDSFLTRLHEVESSHLRQDLLNIFPSHFPSTSCYQSRLACPRSSDKLNSTWSGATTVELGIMYGLSSIILCPAPVILTQSVCTYAAH